MQLARRHLIASLLATTVLSSVSPRARAGGGKRRPNIITIILDDVGYSDIGCFGSEIRTPHIDQLAAQGLRYTRFDTKAVCSNTRAALLTGRNSHTVNFPDVPDLGGAEPSNDGLYALPTNAWTMAQVLQREGYATWNIGKWHLTPGAELAEGASRKNWPRQRGFDYFYGFPKGWTDQYRPQLVENESYLNPTFPEGYHLSADLTDKAIGLIEKNAAAAEPAPFYLNLAYGTAHAPIQVPREYSRKYDDVYARGWDAIRGERFERMKRMGVIPPSTQLTPRTSDDRAWADLNEDEKVVFARYMAVYAGFIEHCDEQIGRLLDRLDALGLARDTIIVLFSDNGAAGAAGQEGEFEAIYRPNTLTPAEQRRRIDELGTASTQSEYPRPWALAGVTPLRRYKIWPYSGGTRTPMIVRWPEGIGDAGAIRRQFVDVIDIAPTLLAAAGTGFPKSVEGVAQLPVAGRSMLPTFRSARAPGRQVQYFELRGNRAITDGRWRAVAMHECGTPFEEDEWQLFDIDQDFSEAVNLAKVHPDRLAAMQSLWASEWARYGKSALSEPGLRACHGPALAR